MGCTLCNFDERYLGIKYDKDNSHVMYPFIPAAVQKGL